jgi:16S rRNA (guanine966-N2)-methyltransferase
MRIVGGKYKGRIFKPNKSFTARPTTDLAKESLFNILMNRYDFTGMKILDLFSGTGSIGYEFASREAGEVTLVEKNLLHVRFIHDVVEKLQINNAHVVHDDVFRFLKFTRKKFDIVFADPPYDFPFISEIPLAVSNSEVLKDGGLLIIEHSKDQDFSSYPFYSETRKYGKVNFSFFIYN